MMCIRHQLLNVFMSELLLRDQSRKKRETGWMFAGISQCAGTYREQDT